MSKKIVGIILATVVVLGLVGLGVWLFVSGKLVWSNGAVQPTGTAIVCGDDTVEAYNKVAGAAIRDDSGIETVDTEGKKKIAEEVRTKSGYEKDPTCQTIIFQVNYQEGDYEATKATYDALISLHDQHLYADNNLIGVAPTNTYLAMTEALSPENAGKGRNGDE